MTRGPGTSTSPLKDMFQSDIQADIRTSLAKPPQLRTVLVQPSEDSLDGLDGSGWQAKIPKLRPQSTPTQTHIVSGVQGLNESAS